VTLLVTPPAKRDAVLEGRPAAVLHGHDVVGVRRWAQEGGVGLAPEFLLQALTVVISVRAHEALGSEITVAASDQGLGER